MNKMIYLDNHATTSCDERVVEAMLPYFTEDFGNSASRAHPLGKVANEALEKARGEVASLLGASSNEIIFTSGATESINLAIAGVASAYKEKGNHLITAATEHKAVLYSLAALKAQGFEVTVLPVDRFGFVDVKDVQKALTHKTILISIMSANNEIGTLHPAKEIGKLAKEREILFLCDAVQSVGKIPVDVNDLGIDLLPLSAHKIYGPKGTGALYIRKSNPRVRLTPTIFGGGQEKGLRSGTVNVPGIVGLGKAAEIVQSELKTEGTRLTLLRDRLKNSIMSKLTGVTLNGHPTSRLPNNLSLSFEGIDGEALFRALWGRVAASSGATCTSTSIEPSHVLTAIGVTAELAKNTVRFGLGRKNTEVQIDEAARMVVESVSKLREQNAIFEVAAEPKKSSPHKSDLV